MVDIKTSLGHPSNAPVVTPGRDPSWPEARGALVRRRLAAAEKFRIPGVRVVPKDDEMRVLLKHPNGMAFRPEGGVEWPNDSFTQRRLADGDVTLEPAGAQEKAEAERVEKAETAKEPKK